MEGESEEAAYKIKYVKWPPWAASPRNVPILLQDVNGPCPLIAIINVLLLRGTIALPMEAGEIPQARCVMLFLLLSSGVCPTWLCLVVLQTQAI